MILEATGIKNRVVDRARADRDALNTFVRDNNRFILRCASRVCKRFITESDDEYEVALVAFCEAVRTFNAEAGGFEGFAALVIRRRLMDYFDRQTRRAREIAAGSAMTWDEAEDSPPGVIAEVQRAIVDRSRAGERTVKDEIESLGQVLDRYGFTFFDLADASPRAAKTKACCARAVNWMLEVVERVLEMRRRRSLPVSAMSKALEIARKILERHRRYIIAATEILDGDYPQLAEYLSYIRKGR